MWSVFHSSCHEEVIISNQTLIYSKLVASYSYDLPNKTLHNRTKFLFSHVRVKYLLLTLLADVSDSSHTTGQINYPEVHKYNNITAHNTINILFE